MAHGFLWAVISASEYLKQKKHKAHPFPGVVGKDEVHGDPSRRVHRTKDRMRPTQVPIETNLGPREDTVGEKSNLGNHGFLGRREAAWESRGAKT